MPLDSYVVGHPEANLSNEDRKVLIDYFKKERRAILESNLISE